METKKQSVEQAVIVDQTVIKEGTGKPVVAGKGKIEEVITITEDDLEVYVKRGKGFFMAGHYQEALEGFEAILRVAPAHIETRIWARKTKEALSSPQIEGAFDETKAKCCVWMKMGLVAHRLCTFDYDCLGCEFDVGVRVRMATGDPEVLEVLQKQAELPGNKKLCRYALKQEVSYRLCSRMFQCATCEFSQNMERVAEQKLDARQKAIDKKQGDWWWPYWGLNVQMNPKQSTKPLAAAKKE
ncbi:MAG: hypothetical protein PHY28_03625 [Dehalococcoidales bacterium]|nr:hypothetical protein [Dehalococcoidales bacterium]